MQYMFLIYAAEDAHPPMGTPEGDAYMGAYMSLSQEYMENGKMQAGAPLEGLESATTVRVRDGGNQTTDGPFAETKEALGGYYIVDCNDLDEAIEFAGKIPTASVGSIEIRPVRDMIGAAE